MLEKNDERKNAYLSLVTLAFINSGIFGIIYLRTGYYNVVQNAMGLSHIQMGNVWTIYGVISVFSYLFGGFLADRYDSKKLVILSAIGIVVSGVIFWTIPSYNVLIVVYALYAFFAIFTYYATSVKIVSGLGKVIGPGRVFGLYWALVYSSNIFASVAGIKVATLFEGNDVQIIRWVVMIYELIIISALVLFICFFKLSFSKTKAEEKKSLKEMIMVLGDKKICIISLIVFFNYLVVSCFSYFTPFFRDILGLSQESVLWINIIKSDLLGTVITLSIGIITDKIGSAVKLIGVTSLIGALLLGILVIGCGFKMPWLISVGIAILITLVVNGAKSVTMACVSEMGISSEIAGRAIGIICFIGYLPDAFYYLFAGRIIEKYGKGGYEFLFMLSAFMAVLCCLSCYVLYRSNGKRKENT